MIRQYMRGMGLARSILDSHQKSGANVSCRGYFHVYGLRRFPEKCFGVWESRDKGGDTMMQRVNKNGVKSLEEKKQSIANFVEFFSRHSIGLGFIVCNHFF